MPRVIDGRVATRRVVIVNTDDLADNSVTNPKMADSSVDTAELVDSAVATAKIADSAIQTAKVADSAIAAGKIADGGVDATSRLADSIVATAKVIDGDVTDAKLASLFQGANLASIDSVSAYVSFPTAYSDTPVVTTAPGPGVTYARVTDVTPGSFAWVADASGSASWWAQGHK